MSRLFDQISSFCDFQEKLGRGIAYIAGQQGVSAASEPWLEFGVSRRWGLFEPSCGDLRASSLVSQVLTITLYAELPNIVRLDCSHGDFGDDKKKAIFIHPIL